MRDVELLAPVGSFEALKAAVQNGANAVYLGGKDFGARASANNFDRDELKEAVKYAHIRGVQVFVTTNTLRKENEIEDFLEYAKFLYDIDVDAIISSQLLINIFEHNTPLHDGAVIVRGDRVTSATCYLPLSENMDISKELGTRHRAALGVSEVTDSFTIIVSEETGAVSVAVGGKLIRNIDGDKLRSHLIKIQNKQVDVKKFRLWKVKKQ